MPTLWYGDGSAVRCDKLSVDPAESRLDESGGRLAVRLADMARGTLAFDAVDSGLHLTRLALHWEDRPLPLRAMYFGASPLTREQHDFVPSLERPFWPNWRFDSYCIPSGKPAPMQSFFRRWDMGHANFALGSFGPAMSTPYAAAYPRPLFSAAMGNDTGWVVMGCGEVPDGAMTFQVRSSSACIEYLYREDLWGPPTDRERVWDHPLRLAWAPVAWDAFAKYFATFDLTPVPPHHQRSYWNTWGSFRHRDFDLKAGVAAARKMEVDLLCIDEPWEVYSSCAIPNRERFPDFDDDLDAARSAGLHLGFWQASGWVPEPAEIGLNHEDLLCGVDGRPRLANWGLDPYESGPRYYCVDPSSPKVQAFLRERTERVMALGADLLKVDFAYGLPGPDVASPRDPGLRGERLGLALLGAIAEYARAINPDVTIQNFSIHPLMRPVADIISLDDLGDAGGEHVADHEVSGHAQWSVWAALAGTVGTAINASSGYNWEADAEVLLNTAVIGAPGGIASTPEEDDSPATSRSIGRRRALARWHRRATSWHPLWLNSHPGSEGREPTLNCWGRLEPIDGVDQLTAVALRDGQHPQPKSHDLAATQWRGAWALISQDDRCLTRAQTLACIPLGGTTITLRVDRPIQKCEACYGSGHTVQLGPDPDHPSRITLDAAAHHSDGELLGFLVHS